MGRSPFGDGANQTHERLLNVDPFLGRGFDETDPVICGLVGGRPLVDRPLLLEIRLGAHEEGGKEGIGVTSLLDAPDQLLGPLEGGWIVEGKEDEETVDMPRERTLQSKKVARIELFTARGVIDFEEGRSPVDQQLLFEDVIEGGVVLLDESVSGESHAKV